MSTTATITQPQSKWKAISWSYLGLKEDSSRVYLTIADKALIQFLLDNPEVNEARTKFKCKRIEKTDTPNIFIVHSKDFFVNTIGDVARWHTGNTVKIQVSNGPRL